jgi:PAS domain S-box-containing protein
MAMLRGPEHVFELTNAAYLQLIGHRNVIGRTATEALPEIAGQGFFELLDRVYATGEAYVGANMPVALQRTPDGPTEQRFVDLVYQPITDVTGAVTGIFVEGADVTERVRADVELRKSEERFRELIERAPEKMWVNQPDGSVAYFNAAWRDYTGHPVVPEGLSWVEAIHPDDRARIIECRSQGVEAGEAYEVEVRIRRTGDDAWRWHVGRVAPVRRDGTIFAWVGMAADIDDARRAQEQMRDLNATLESRVAERTAELEAAHDQLRQSQKMEAIGQLTGGLAHDLNNMLTIVTGNMDMARRSLASGDEPRAHRAIANAIRGAESASGLTRRLLAFARRQPLAPKTIDAGELVDGMSELLARALGETVTLGVTNEPGLRPIYVDPHQIENAVLNLAVNSKDAMPGGGTLTITTANVRVAGRQAMELELAPGAYVTVSVSDTGAGMPADVVARAFEPFYTTKEQGKGTGLGLSMVYGFAKQSGGSVAIESRPGNGTTVRLFFPAVEWGAVGVSTGDGVATEERPGSETILLVEDQEDVADLAESILVDAGYRVLRAATGEEALRRLDEAPDVDLIFSDVVMPGEVSGIALAHEARRRRPGMKVLLTSGYTAEPLARTDFPVLNKPYRRGDLLAYVREVLDPSATST